MAEEDRVGAVRDELLALVSEHETTCPGSGRSCWGYRIGLLAYLAHCLALGKAGMSQRLIDAIAQFDSECTDTGCTAEVKPRQDEPLPFNPMHESILKARYHAAVRKLYTWTEIKASDRPGRHSENVFDWLDGMRMIISREHCDPPQREPMLHVSLSVSSDGEVAKKIEESAGAAIDEISRRFQAISGRPLPPCIGRVGGVLHFAGPFGD